MPKFEGFKESKDYERRFYLEEKNEFEDVMRIINLMASFAVYKTEEAEHTDYYFETPNNFFAGFNASIRLREGTEGKFVSIKYVVETKNELGITKTVKEYSQKVKEDSFITNDEDAMLFLEDKIREVFNHFVDMDILRILRTLRPVLVVKTERTTQFVKNNDKFACTVSYDYVAYKTKRKYDEDRVIEIKLDCVPTDDNLNYYEAFFRELRNRTVLIPMGETKYEVGMRVRNFVKYKKKKKGEQDEEE